MNLVPFVVVYGSMLVFLLVVAARIAMWLRMPMHVRWELYPVPHEGHRAEHGGSYLEQSDWWTKPREKSLVGELKLMLPEILFLVALRENNRKLWRRSFPFHMGLYCVSVCTALMVLGGLLGVVWPGASELRLFAFVFAWVVPVLGFAGLALGLLGALGLLQRRLMDPALRDFTSRADLFNLVFFVVVFGLLLATNLWADRGFVATSAFVQNLLVFETSPPVAGGLAAWAVPVGGALLAVLCGYIPMTHMSHFIGKYFAYHAIRWDDEPNLRGGPREARIQKQLEQPVTWAAPHIKGDGKKTWGELATEEQKK